MPEPKEHAENRGWIETILQYIPGFRGYLKKENRREADELQREWLADHLQRSKRGLNEYAFMLTEAGRLDEINRVERIRTKLDKVIARIRGAMQGYSGFFDLVNIDEAVLDRVYEYDVSLMKQTAQLSDDISALGDSDAEAKEALGPISEQLDAIDEAWDQREDILKGLE